MIFAAGAWPLSDTLIALLLIGLVYVVLKFWDREKDGTNLAQVWRSYAAKHGDRVDVPGRFAFLSLSEAQVHAKLEGVRNGLPFTVEITAYDPEEGGEKDTSFQCSPTWLPDGAMITITRGQPSKSWGASPPPPAISTNRLNVYLQPPELASAFATPQGQRLLADFGKLPRNADATGWRKDANEKYHGVKSILFLTMDTWCDDADQLDATIDVLTRLCNLRAI